MPVEIKDYANNLKAAFKRLTQTRVLVGIPQEENQRESEGTHEITNAELGYIHEYGAPEVNIPARPFLVPGVASVQDEVTRRFKDAALGALKGDYTTVDKNLNAIGIIAVSAVRAGIQDGIPSPLSPRTIAARRQRTKNSSYKRKAITEATPLIDTGQLLHSITYVLDEDGKRKVITDPI